VLYTLRAAAILFLCFCALSASAATKDDDDTAYLIKHKDKQWGSSQPDKA
jgi:hypothetical protein